MERTWQHTGTGEAMKAVGQARLELSGASTPDRLWPHPLPLLCPSDRLTALYLWDSQ